MKRRLPPEPGDGYEAGTVERALGVLALREALEDPLFRLQFENRLSHLPHEDRQLATDCMTNLEAGILPDQFETAAAFSVGPLRLTVNYSDRIPTMAIVFED